MIIVKKAYDFSKWLLQHTGKFPKSYRFSVAVRIENAVLEFTEILAVANMETDGRNPGLYRLPTEVEWEYAASGKERRPYPWGTPAPTSHRANFKSRKEATTPVGRYPEGATPDGLCDMAGNVWEWMSNWNAQEKEKFFTRGGSWDTSPDYLRCTVSGFQRPVYRSSDIGFRVVRSAI
ncbi:MAG: SUMF1/EgtB/PvdO family nonheme iron enzyme [Chlorobiaceae bacterium]|nr:SUMF1/EgtB/PvdO family nonheme iron enzyme [Chlorobiaceae bacterium]